MPSGAIITTLGLAKLASATPLNQLNISALAVGDGNGGYPTLDPSMTALANEVWRGTPSPPIRDPNSPNVLIFEAVIPPSVGGFTVREQAIFDDAGDMIAIGQTSVVEKPLPNAATGVMLTVRLHVQLDNTGQVDLFFQDDPTISAGNVRDENGGSVQDFIDAQSTTVAELATGKFKVGQHVRLTDREMGIFLLQSGGTPDGYGILNAGNRNTAVVVVIDYLNPKWLGLKINGIDVDDWEPIINFVIPNSPTFIRGGVEYYKAKYPIKFLGISRVDKTVRQTKIPVGPNKKITGLSISGFDSGMSYATPTVTGSDSPMLSGFNMPIMSVVDTPILEIKHMPIHYIGKLAFTGVAGVTVGIRREDSANGLIEYLDISNHKTGIYSLRSGITRGDKLSVSNCDVGGIRNIGSGDSNFTDLYLNTNGIDYTGSDFVTGAGITFEAESNNCNYNGGKNEFNAKGLVILDSQGINIDNINWDANRLGSIHMYNTSDTLNVMLKSINIGTTNRFLSGGQEGVFSKDQQIYIETFSPIDITIGGSFRRSGPLAYDDGPADITRVVGPIKSVVQLYYLGSNPSHELNIRFNCDANRGANQYFLTALSNSTPAKLNVYGDATRDLPNVFTGFSLENGIKLKTTAAIQNNGTVTYAGGRNIGSITRVSLGNIRVTFKTPYDDTSYIVLPNITGVGFSFETNKDVSFVDIGTRNSSGDPVDVDFDFMVV